MLFSIEKYFFDAGDCCLEDVKCRWCDDYLDIYFCEDANCPPLENLCIPSTLYCVPEELGDGKCQDYNNGPFCDFDLGDCCISDESAYESCCQCTGHICPKSKKSQFGNSLNSCSYESLAWGLFHGRC